MNASASIISLKLAEEQLLTRMVPEVKRTASTALSLIEK